MLSILIPTYNYDVVSLVTKVHAQCLKQLNQNFEILIYDDCSTDNNIVAKNESLNALENCNFKILPNNIGRSAIRNKLSQDAKYDWLLFLDADVMPISEDFILNYISVINEEPCVIYGGILYPETDQDDLKTLRWHYGKKREALNYLDKSNYSTAND